MFNYIKETILNKVDGNVKLLTGADGVEDILMIKRVANYDLGKICGGLIVKTEPVEGKTGKLTISIAKGDTVMFFIESAREFVEFATPNYDKFGKPFIANKVENLKEALQLLAGDGHLFKINSADETSAEIEVVDPYLSFARAYKVSYEAQADGSEKETVEAIDVDAGKGELPFATAEWLSENLRLPSYENVRMGHPYADESPIRGQKYVQYAFELLNERSVPGGVSGVGQKVDSITNHVIYVLESEAEAFENIIPSSISVKKLEDTQLTKDTKKAGERE